MVDCHWLQWASDRVPISLMELALNSSTGGGGSGTVCFPADGSNSLTILVTLLHIKLVVKCQHLCLLPDY